MGQRALPSRAIVGLGATTCRRRFTWLWVGCVSARSIASQLGVTEKAVLALARRIDLPKRDPALLRDLVDDELAGRRMLAFLRYRRWSAERCWRAIEPPGQTAA